jgi:EAL domain-containing protein (putative c-di-GMP-specific phosphodiesterase class I)
VEALARVTDSFGGQLIPTVLFAAETSPRRSVFLDRQLRCLHLLNFLLQHPGPDLILSLNVNAQHLVNVSEAHGQFFAEVLQKLNIPASRICLEVVEDAVSDPLRLLEAVQRYAAWVSHCAGRFWPGRIQSGARLAAGAGLRQAGQGADAPCADAPQRARQAGRLVDILHLHGAQVVGEGIESAMQLDIARAAGCDFVQGFHLARPAELLNLPAEPPWRHAAVRLTLQRDKPFHVTCARPVPARVAQRLLQLQQEGLHPQSPIHFHPGL